MFLKKITIEGYKTIRSLKEFELRGLNVLVGANGAGKSNFLSFFSFLSAVARGDLQIYTATKGGADALLYFGSRSMKRLYSHLEFTDPDYINEYIIQMIPTEDGRIIFSNEMTKASKVFEGRWRTIGSGAYQETALTSAKESISPYILKALHSFRKYHFHDTGDSSPIKSIHDLSDTLRFKPDGSNLMAWLLHLRKKQPSQAYYQMIVENIRRVAPFFGDFVQREEYPGDTVQLEWTERGHPDTPLKGHLLSDGTLRFMCLSTLLLQPPYYLPSIVIIDEPELGLHPSAITLLAEMFKQVAETQQLIISTQSVELINALEPEDVIVVDREGDESQFRRLDREKLAAWLEEYALGDIWKMNIFGGRPG
ncbi:MAG: AAA family ATPase [Magnetococcales bacterium]|nr:AAA family ATPase [Magnetococcales bacterium]